MWLALWFSACLVAVVVLIDRRCVVPLQKRVAQLEEGNERLQEILFSGAPWLGADVRKRREQIVGSLTLASAPLYAATNGISFEEARAFLDGPFSPWAHGLQNQA
jgi:hypothetical protein